MAEEGINLTIYKAGETNGKDITGLVKQVKWDGRRGSPARSITFTLLDDDGYGHARSGIDVAQGYTCIFKWKGKELFRGIIMTQSGSEKKTAEYKAYDNGIYLSNNKDTYCYEKKKASDIFTDVCKRYGIKTDTVAATKYTIPDLTKKRTTAWDAIEDALSLEFDNTRTRYYVFSEKGKLSLRKRTDNVLQWVLEVGANISSYKYSKSIEDVKTRIKLLSDEGKVLAEAADVDMEKIIGRMQDVDTPDENLNSAQITALAKSMLAEKKVPVEKITLSKTIGIPDVIAGVAVFVIIPHLGIKRTLYVEQDSHTFQGNMHQMTLQLVYMSDAGVQEDSDKASGAAKNTHKVGDVVNFHGGYHYVGSSAPSPTGGVRKGGKAKIAYTNPGAPHPWSLIGGAYNSIGGDCNVYGWVDDGTFD